jgi:D-3-phosphoglycerate dehydrogenase
MQNHTMTSSNGECVPVGASYVVLLADSFQAKGIERLESIGCIVEFEPTLTGDALLDTIAKKQPTVLVVRSTKVSEEMMDASDSLSLIIRAGAGYDTIDIAAASNRGISVANCPGRNSIAVAELTWGLILSCDRRIPDQVMELRQQCWNKKEYSNANGLFGRTVGIVGLGGIGLEVMHRAKSFGMNVVAWSRSLTEEKASELGVSYCEQLNDLAAVSDVVTVHVASTTNTEKLIDRQFLSLMKKNAIFINTSRGSVVDELALVEISQSSQLRVGLDVYSKEPSSSEQSFTSAITSESQIYGTHHVGASTRQAQEAITSEAVRIIESFVEEGRVWNCVNQSVDSIAIALLSIRHKNLPGVLASVFDELSIAGINVEEMENILYKGGQAACARIQLGDTPTLDLIQAIRRDENIISATLTTKN